MTDDGGRPKDDRPDPFAPLPLKESLTGKAKRAASAPAAPTPAPAPAPQAVATTDSPAYEPTEPSYEPSPAAYEAPVAHAAAATSVPSVNDEPSGSASAPAAYAPPSYDTPPSPDLAIAPSRNSEPLLPSTYDENDLRVAVGATPRPETPAKAKKKRAATPSPVEPDDDDDGASRPRSRKTMIIAALTLFVGTGIGALIFIGRINSGRFVIACEANRMVVERGRSFPPWGTTSMGGATWKPLDIPPEAECHDRETEDTAELASWYGKALVDQATTLLTAREVTKVDEAEAQLKQALLVSRLLGTEDERTNARNDIERLLGDVGYWRASAKLRSASDALTAAAKEFDVAAAQRPRHVTDAAAWATFVRKLVGDLEAGPSGAPTAFPPLPPSERPTAPPGVALPVEPVAGTGSGSAALPPEPPPPDAGVPTGGVLL